MTLTPNHYQANRLDLLSRLAGDISHEIKNPLHAMVINLELVRRKVDKGESAAALERVAIVEEEIRKVHALANGLLEALRPPRDAQTACVFTPVLQELSPVLMARARCARVEFELDSEASAFVLPLAAHEVRLLLLNLTDRAVRGAVAGGRIGITTRASTGQLAIDVVSPGAALDEAEAAWLRDRPADAEHIDLGLRVVRDLVTRIDGSIAAAPTPEGGHALSLVLPAAASA